MQDRYIVHTNKIEFLFSYFGSIFVFLLIIIIISLPSLPLSPSLPISPPLSLQPHYYGGVCVVARVCIVKAAKYI